MDEARVGRTGSDPEPGSGADGLIEWVRASFDAVRAELRALSSVLSTATDSNERVRRATESVEQLAGALPERLGSAIAAAIEQRQDAFLSGFEQTNHAFSAAVHSVDAHREQVTAALEERNRTVLEATARVADLAEVVQEALEHSASELDRVSALIASAAERGGQSATEELRSLSTAVTERLDRVEQSLIEQTVSARRDVTERLHGVSEAFRRLPADELKSHAERIAEALGQLEGLSTRITGTVDERLREQERAVTASVQSRVDETLGGLETRVADTVAERINALVTQIDRLRHDVEASRDADAERFAQRLASETVTPLTRAIEQLAERLTKAEAAATQRDADSTAALASRVESGQRGILDATGARFADLQERLDGLQTTIDGVGGRDEHEALSAQVSALAERFEQLAAATIDLAPITRGLAAIDQRIDALPPVDLGPLIEGMGDLDGRVERVAAAVAAIPPPPEPAPAPEVDLTPITEALRSLDERVESVAEAVTAIPPPPEPTPAPEVELGPLVERLERLEQLVAPLVEGLEVDVDLSAFDERIDAITDGLDRLRRAADDVPEPPAPAPIPEVPTAEEVGAVVTPAVVAEVGDLVRRVVGDLVSDLSARVDALAAAIPSQAPAAPEPTPVDLSGVEARLDALGEQVDKAYKVLARLRRPKPLAAKRAKPAAADSD